MPLNAETEFKAVPRVAKILSYEVVATPPDVLAAHPHWAKQKLQFRVEPVSYRDREDAKQPGVLSVDVSTTKGGACQKFILAFDKAAKAEGITIRDFEDPSELAPFIGRYVEFAWDSEKRSRGNDMVWLNIFRFLTDEEGEATRISAPASPTYDSPGLSANAGPTIEQVVLELIGDGATQAEIKSRFAESSYKDDNAFRVQINRGSAVNKLVEAGKVTETDGRYTVTAQ